MEKQGTILVGTIGQGVMMSADGGGAGPGPACVRACIRTVSSRLSCPTRGIPARVYAGTDMGLYKSDDGGAGWHLLDTPMNGSMVWSMAIDPVDSNVMFAGTGTPSQPGIFRSADGGKTWERLPVEIALDCPNVGIPGPRVSRWTPPTTGRCGSGSRSTACGTAGTAARPGPR